MADIPNEDEDLNSLLTNIDTTPPEHMDGETTPTGTIMGMIEPVIEPVLSEPIPPQLPASDIAKIEPISNDLLGLKAMLQKFCAAAESIIANHAADRSQIEAAIVYFEGIVKAMQTAGDRPSAPFVEGWVTLLQTKSEINTNATRVLDSMAKLLAAAKNNNIILNFGGGGSKGNNDNIDLNQLLSQPVEEYEDLDDD